MKNKRGGGVLGICYITYKGGVDILFHKEACREWSINKFDFFNMGLVYSISEI